VEVQASIGRLEGQERKVSFKASARSIAPAQRKMGRETATDDVSRRPPYPGGIEWAVL
jgi:hypothetical protein